MHIRIILEFSGKYKCPGIAFFLQSSRCVSNEQPCLKTTGLYDDFMLLSNLFHLFYFTLSAPISFHLCFPVSLSPSQLLFFLKLLSRIVEKLLQKSFSLPMLVRLCSKSCKLVLELRTSRCTNWVQKRQRNQRSIC